MEHSRGKVLSIAVSQRRGTRKTRVSSARAIADFGLENDAHAGDWHRQVSLLPFESFKKLGNGKTHLKPGDFAENITTLGLDLSELKVGDRVLIGDEVTLEVTQIGKECHQACVIRELTGDCIMPKEGVFARVVKGGSVNIGAPMLVHSLPWERDGVEE